MELFVWSTCTNELVAVCVSVPALAILPQHWRDCKMNKQHICITPSCNFIMRLTIFCGCLLTPETEIQRLLENLCFDFSRIKVLRSWRLQRKIWKLWCNFATEIQKENTKNHKSHFISWGGWLMCFGQWNLQYCVGSLLPYFTYEITHPTTKKIL